MSRFIYFYDGPQEPLIDIRNTLVAFVGIAHWRRLFKGSPFPGTSLVQSFIGDIKNGQFYFRLVALFQGNSLIAARRRVAATKFTDRKAI